MKKFRLAIFASGSGSNAERISQYFLNHAEVEVALILSNNEKAAVLDKAAKLSIDTCSFNKEDFKAGGRVEKLLADQKITHVILAGFLWLVPGFLIQRYPDKIVNIHPALLPKHGGKGMYGRHVHEAVKKAGEHETGITIHLVNEKFDEGKHLFQAACSVMPTDTVEAIAAKVQVLEHQHYPAVIEQWLENS
jgi:phosphoribosylglycinamide formyltransferase-1